MACILRRCYLILLLTAVVSYSGADTTAPTLTAYPDKPLAGDFILTDYEGNVHKLSEYKGKVVLLNFWATWCPPCREEMPSMQRAWGVLREHGIAMLAVNVGEDEDTIFAFTASYPVEFPLLMDSDSLVIRQWPIQGLPTTFVLDEDSRIVYRAIGGRAWDHPALINQIIAIKNNRVRE